MTFGIFMCALVIVLCILTNGFLKRFGIPAVLIFVILGMLFGSEGIVKIPFDNYALAENICSTALIFIMFFGGFGTSFKEAKPVLVKSILLASLGTVITALLTGILCYYLIGLDFMTSMLIGAVLGSTDAASVFSILRSRKLNLKDGTASLLEVESGSNDPFAYILTVTILNMMCGNGGNAVLMIAQGLFFGLLFGAILGIAAVKILQRIPMESEGVSVILIIAFVLFAYAVPSLFGGNGYLSVYLFGIITGNVKFSSKISLVRFFESIDQLAQILIFFLLGLLVFPSRLVPVFGIAVLIFLILTFIARPAAVFSLLTPFCSPFRQQILTAFAGLRGASAAVFAIMAVVSPAYAGPEVYHIVFCVIIISSSFQGLLLPAVSEKLQMVDDSQNVMKTFSDYREEQDMQLIQIRLNRGHRYIGKHLNELNFNDLLVVLIERNGESLVPRGDTLLCEGDTLVLSGETYQGSKDTVLQEVSIESGNSNIGKMIRDIGRFNDSLIVLIRRKDGSTVIPKGNTVIQEGDILVLSKP
jgi:cell volume regulation protein A